MLDDGLDCRRHIQPLQNDVGVGSRKHAEDLVREALPESFHARKVEGHLAELLQPRETKVVFLGSELGEQFLQIPA